MLYLRYLSQIYTVLRFDPRLWQVLEMRLDKSMTLAEIGCKLGITRERVRQIERRAWNQFVNNDRLIMPVLDLLEKSIRVKIIYDRKKFISHVSKVLRDQDFVGTKAEIAQLVLLVRALVFLDPELDKVGRLEKHWPRLSFIACRLDPIVTRHINAFNDLKKEKEREKARNKKYSYKELAMKILEDEGKALHWKEIADRAYHFGHRQSFNSTALYNSLMNYPNLFVRVGAGTYALAIWGFDEVEYYPEIIAYILKAEGRALPSETIYHRVNEKRQIKRTTLIMLLDMHPRFYRSLENTYGLRVWLAPREKQTLRTPERLVESLDSYDRLAQASQRGYNVDSMLQLDMVES